ncbi:protein-tyrosine phosphatase-like protein [Spinellus fusiger]|nr:protein-tyrosine phosphatase-like protein [Spinellus fusiger]
MSVSCKSPSPSPFQSNPRDLYFKPVPEPNETLFRPSLNNATLHTEFFNAIQSHHSGNPQLFIVTNNHKTPSARSSRPSSPLSRYIKPISCQGLEQVLKNKSPSVLLIDVRSFLQYSYARIHSAINVAVPSTILRRPTFTIDKISTAIVSVADRSCFQQWKSYKRIIIYDHISETLSNQCSAQSLASKFVSANYLGHLNYLQGGFDTFKKQYPYLCESHGENNNNSDISSTQQNKMALKLPTNNHPIAALGPLTVPAQDICNPFFSNIRQNEELAHGPIKERIPIHLPPHVQQDLNNNVLYSKKAPRARSSIRPNAHGWTMDTPEWIASVLSDKGPEYLAKMYERLERTEQQRLQHIIAYHSKHSSSNPSDFPLSIVAGIEKGSLNRYTNIWPYEYTRVKVNTHSDSGDYMNASYIQYETINTSTSDSLSLPNVSNISLRTMSMPKSKTSPFRRYISTQGPLPTTFNDFWNVVWEQNTRVLVMLTKEEEMHKIKCHCYWPTSINTPIYYGHSKVTLLSQKMENTGSTNPDDCIITSHLELSQPNQETRRITHLQYTGWNDFGVPDSPVGTLRLIELADKAQSLHEGHCEAIGPMLVHCSAGCGRSGAFCTIDTAIQQLSTTYTIEKDVIFDIVVRFREQRVSMVQTMRQFVFCYDAVLWWILGYGNAPMSERALSSARENAGICPSIQ